MERESSGGVGSAKTQAKNPLKRMKGSTRDIIDPLESGLKNIYSMIINAEKNYIGSVLAKLADQKNAGSFVERVPTPTKLKARITKEEAITQIKRFIGKEVAEDKVDNIVKQLEQIFPDAFTRFGATQYPAGENIVTVYVDGKPTYYELSPEM